MARAFGASIVWIWSHTSAIPRVCVRVCVCVCVCVSMYMYMIHILCVIYGTMYMYVHPVRWRTTRRREWTNENVYRWRFGILWTLRRYSLCWMCVFHTRIQLLWVTLHVHDLHCTVVTCHRNLFFSISLSLFRFVFPCLKNFLDNNGAFRGTTKLASSLHFVSRNYLINHAGDTRKNYAFPHFARVHRAFSRPITSLLLVRFYLRNTNIPSCFIYLLGTLHMCQYDSQA